MRVTKDRKTSTIHIGYHLLPSDWDAKKQRIKKSHPNHVRLNNLIDTKIAEASDKAIEMDTNHTDTSSKVIMKKIKPNSGASFNKQSDAYLTRLKEAGKFNEYTADKPRIKHFKEFIGSDIVFPDITVSLLENFKHHLLITLKVGKEKRPIKERTALNHLVTIRSIIQPGH